MTKGKVRRENLRHVLDAHRREAVAKVQEQIRQGRHGRSVAGGDLLEQTDANSQSDLQFALVQMRSETLARVNEALRRLDAGQYGSCVECDTDIAESRLKAMPFAVRCRACAEEHEQRTRRQKTPAESAGDSLSPFALVQG